MKTTFIKINQSISAMPIIIILFVYGCDYIPQPMSEIIEDKTAGMNGSFEVVKKGLPVNWFFYTPKTVPTGDFEMISDITEFKDGKRSLKPENAR